MQYSGSEEVFLQVNADSGSEEVCVQVNAVQW
jgi:hypothetical protein